MKTRHLYLVLCFLGLLIPNAMFVPWVVEHGWDPGRFVSDLFANGVSAFFGTDLIISALVVCAFVLFEGKRIGLRNRWAPIAAVFLVGVSLGLPLFLYQRQLHLDEVAA
jgi:membrane associated rhomboid family serine protease